jgi:hypothetical protein
MYLPGLVHWPTNQVDSVSPHPKKLKEKVPLTGELAVYTELRDI